MARGTAEYRLRHRDGRVVWVRDDAMLAASGDRGGPTVLIEGRRAPFGVPGLHSHQPRDYQAGDVDFVRSLAIVLGEAVERLHRRRSLTAILILARYLTDFRGVAHG